MQFFVLCVRIAERMNWMNKKKLNLYNSELARKLYGEIANNLYELQHSPQGSVLQELNPSRSLIWVAACTAATVLLEQSKIDSGRE